MTIFLLQFSVRNGDSDDEDQGCGLGLLTHTSGESLEDGLLPDLEMLVNLPEEDTPPFPSCGFSTPDLEGREGWGDLPLLQDLLLIMVSFNLTRVLRKPAAGGGPPPPLHQVGADEGDQGPGGDRHARALDHLHNTCKVIGTNRPFIRQYISQLCSFRVGWTI